jgi:hypothetical protein
MIAMSLLNTLQFESPLYHTFSAGGRVSLDPVKVGGPIGSLDPIDPTPDKGDECCCEGDYGCILKYMLAHNGKTAPKCRCGYSRNPQEKRCGCGTRGCPCGGVSAGSLSGDCPCGGEGCPDGEPPCDKQDDGGEFDDGNTGNGGTEEEEEEEESLPEGDEDSESLDDFVEEDEGDEDGESDNTEEAEVQENEIDDGRNGMVIQTSGYVEPTCPENSVYDEDEKICKCKLGYSANEGSSACERDTLGFLLEAKWWILGGAALLGAYGYSQSR